MDIMRLLVVISLALLMAGCRSSRERSNEELKLTERLVPVLIYSPGESSTLAFNCDSLLGLINTKKQKGLPDTIVVPSRNGLAELKLYVDAFGRLTAECDAKDRQVKALVKELEIERNRVKEVIKEVLPSWVIPVLSGMAFIIFLLIIILRYGKK